MEFTTGINPINHKGLILLEFFYELSDELYLLVSFTKNTPLPFSIFSNELRIFLHNSDFNNSPNPIE
jgi:negative regulator of genetic competence, sporulation and motility